MDFKNLKYQPTSCLVRPFEVLTAVLPLAFCVQMLHFAYKTCVSPTIVAPRVTNAIFRFTIKRIYLGIYLISKKYPKIRYNIDFIM